MHCCAQTASWGRFGIWIILFCIIQGIVIASHARPIDVLGCLSWIYILLVLISLRLHIDSCWSFLFLVSFWRTFHLPCGHHHLNEVFVIFIQGGNTVIIVTELLETNRHVPSVIVHHFVMSFKCLEELVCNELLSCISVEHRWVSGGIKPTFQLINLKLSICIFINKVECSFNDVCSCFIQISSYSKQELLIAHCAVAVSIK